MMNKLMICIAFMYAFADAAIGQSNEITVLFAYTTKAAMEVGGPKQIKKNVDNGLKQLNEALTNSNVGYKAVAIPEFVHVKDISVQEDKNLISEFAKVDGRYNKVHKFRKAKRADLMCLIFEGGDNKTSKGMLDGEVMVVTAQGAWDGSWIFPHEFGHVLGAIHGDDVGNGKNYNFMIDGTQYRTVSNNGGVAIPYFSEDRTVNYVKDGKSHSIKIGDKDYQNAVTIRKNAPKKVTLGENLPDVPDAANAIDAELVNPETAPNPPGTKTPFALKEFKFTKDGKLTIIWDASVDYAKMYNSYEIKIFDEKGQPDNWLTKQKGFINPGYSYDASYTTNRAERIKDGYKAELWYEVDGKKVMELRAVSVIGGEDKILGAEPETASPPVTPPPSTPATPSTESLVTIDQIHSFQSVNFPTKYIRHQGGKGKITEIVSDLDKKDASFKVVPALDGSDGYISLESTNYPGYYLRHQSFVVKIYKYDGSELFKKDASFKVVPGLAGQGVSFQSVNFPDRYIRHSGFSLFLNPSNGSDLFKKDASFIVSQFSCPARESMEKYRPFIYPENELLANEKIVSSNGKYQIRFLPEDVDLIIEEVIDHENCEYKIVKTIDGVYIASPPSPPYDPADKVVFKKDKIEPIDENNGSQFRIFKIKNIDGWGKAQLTEDGRLIFLDSKDAILWDSNNF